MNYAVRPIIPAEIPTRPRKNNYTEKCTVFIFLAMAPLAELPAATIKAKTTPIAYFEESDEESTEAELVSLESD